MIIIDTHVDDFLWASDPEVEWIVEEIRKHLTVGREKEYTFVFCGRGLVQNRDTFEIKITCRSIALKGQEIRMRPARAKQITESATPDEQQQLQVVNGTLGWIARRAVRRSATEHRGRRPKAVVRRWQTSKRRAILSETSRRPRRRVCHSSQDAIGTTCAWEPLQMPATQVRSSACQMARSSPTEAREQNSSC